MFSLSIITHYYGRSIVIAPGDRQDHFLVDAMAGFDFEFKSVDVKFWGINFAGISLRMSWFEK